MSSVDKKINQARAVGCVFGSIRASMIRRSRKLALRLKHFARRRKSAQISLRKPRHHCLALSFFY